MKTLIIGLGNPILGDDGVGWKVAEAIRARAPHLEVDCLSVGGLRLMEHMLGYERVILVDALCTGRNPPGSVQVMPLTALPDPGAGHSASAHDATLRTALCTARRLGAPIPQRVHVVAIETNNAYVFREDLSPPVAAAIPLAVQAVFDLLQEAAMISPELLRRFPFFHFMDDRQLKAVAMIAEEQEVEDGTLLVEYNHPADRLFFLLEGAASYYCVITSEHDPDYQQEYYISDFNPGEIFGISSLIEPYHYNARVRAPKGCRLIVIDAPALRALCEVDIKLKCGLTSAVAKAAMERLQSTRAQLAAAKV